MKEDVSSTITGVLVDVSASMKYNVKGEVDTKNGWIRSVFNALNDLIVQSDVTGDHKVFAIGVGGDRTRIFDLLNTLKDAKEKSVCNENPSEAVRPKRDIIRRSVRLLERSGAPYLSAWVSAEMLELYVQKDDALTIWKLLKDNHKNIRETVARECLPPECRSRLQTAGLKVMNLVKNQNQNQGQSMPQNIKDVVHKIRSHIFKPLAVTPKAVMDVRTASDILRGVVEESHSERLSNRQIDQLITSVEWYIFGGSPLNRALVEVEKLFGEYKNYRKLLFVLSDGKPTDELVCDPPIQELYEAGVIIVSCFISPNNIPHAKRLYATEQPHWGDEEKYMYNLSSSLQTQSIPRTIFAKRGWTIDIENNRVKLFAQINHPDVVGDVTDLVNNVLFCQDVLSDLLTTVHLDVYINHSIRRFQAPLQEAGTCYANASATVLHLAMHRIMGREGGYPEFNDLREEIITSYGMHGADTEEVLGNVCPRYRLHFKNVDLKGAMSAIVAKHPVIAIFELEGSEWDAFEMFYKEHPKGVLTKEELCKTFYPRNAKPGGHAVVLVGYNGNFLRFMNSWGSKWADNGFFRVSLTDDVLNCTFYDVYWTETDLRPCEIEAYEINGGEVTGLLMARLQSLQSAKHQCQYCQVSSLVLDFTGSMEEVKCPNCFTTFSIREADANVELAVYLTLLQVQ